MKRFYTEVTAVDRQVLLDGRPVRTPARAVLVLPTAAMAEAAAAEWRTQGDMIDPRAMPVTGLANAAIDRVAPDPAAFAAPLARYGETDLLCYRADAPVALARLQADAWDPPLAWARARYEVRFTVTSGIVHVAQPVATVARLGGALAALGTYALAAMQPLVTIGGSLVAALAVEDRALGAEAAFDATHLDELWQARQWGEDALATQAREARRLEFESAAAFLRLL